MTTELTALLVTAASLGFIHTIIGPDHYLPFIVMARARNWSRARTLWITILCGFGHIGSSVLLGFIGIGFGLAVSHLEGLESVRGSIAAWLMISFGLIYFIWGVRRAYLNKPHSHVHLHSDGSSHDHSHSHGGEHGHVHEAAHQANITPWVLFTIFVFGPCEPLIPILMYPAAQHSIGSLLLVTAVFGGATILTMLGVVIATLSGISLLPTARLERYSHAIAGATILLCGVSIEFLGL
ncbi:hypothetical protein C3F09_08425 [candidate division GN15 bacterium]|uniref:Urease accessory protein UreH-like transmembrane domain-containing protein n=1 Tax=candidate division GN15 bacterium TaxID=2072418 RepID=A0A855X5K5_9BACT|nr:MAG: hypothetical protein C3F09_08425 [candidate division GN15 bacterium]